MPATSRQTRLQIRQSIGVTADAVDMDAGAITHTASEIVSQAKFIDEYLPFGAEDEHRGKWVLWTDSNSSTEVRRIHGSNPDERSITVSVPFSGVTISTGGTYELWDNKFSPIKIHDMVNQAIGETARKGSIHAEDKTFHTGGQVKTFALSSAWSGVKHVEFRESAVTKSVASFDTAPTSLTANVTIITDTADFREGAGSARFNVADGAASSEDLAASSFSAVDLRGYDQLEFWYKTSASITSSNYRVRLMQGSSAEATISVPASSGDVWKYHVAALTSPEVLSSVTAVRFGTGDSDGGSATIWLDDISVSRKGSDQWATAPRDFWTLDHPNREVRLTSDINIPYHWLNIVGVRRPNALSTDSAVCEVDAQYVINSVMAKILRANADVTSGRRDAASIVSGTYEQLAQIQRNRMKMPDSIRWLDD